MESTISSRGAAGLDGLGCGACPSCTGTRGDAQTSSGESAGWTRSLGFGWSSSATESSAASACWSSHGHGFAFDVLVDRAMDIGRCEHDGRALGWDSGPASPGRGTTSRRDSAGCAAWGRPADHLRHRPRPLHGRRHRRAVPLPGKADRGVSALHGQVPTSPRGSPATARAGTATNARSGRRASAAGLRFGEQLVLRRRIEARVGSRASGSTTRWRTSAGTPRRTCTSTTSTSASRSWTKGRSCSCRRSRRSPAASTARGLPAARRAGPWARRAGRRARERRRARRLGPGCGRQPRASGSAPTRSTAAINSPPLHLADARRGDVRRRHRAMHKPNRGPPGRAGVGELIMLDPGRRGTTTWSWGRWRPGRDRRLRGPGREAGGLRWISVSTVSSSSWAGRARGSAGQSRMSSSPRVRTFSSCHATWPPPPPSSARAQRPALPIS